jgi:hypothetical protein
VLHTDSFAQMPPGAESVCPQDLYVRLGAGPPLPTQAHPGSCMLPISATEKAPCRNMGQESTAVVRPGKVEQRMGTPEAGK